MRNRLRFRFPNSAFRITLVLILAALLRVLALNKSLYVDEIVTITVATQSLEDMPRVMRQIDASPALFPLLLHVWLMVGRSDLWARLLPALFGIGGVAVTYLLGRRLFDEPTGLWAAFVAALAPAHVHYAQYVRSYSLFTLLGGIHLLLFARWFRIGVAPAFAGRAQDLRPASAGGQDAAVAQDFAAVAQDFPAVAQDFAAVAQDFSPADTPRRDFILLVLVTAALLYTHYLSLLLFLAEALFAAWRLPQARAHVFRWAAAMSLAAILFLPGVPLLLHNLAFDRLRNEDRPAPPSPVVLLPNLMGELTLGQRAIGFRDPTVRRAVLGGGAVVFAALLAAGATSGWKRNREGTVLLLAVAFVPVLVYVLSERRLVAVRFFLPFMLGYIVLVGRGLVAFRPPSRAAMAALVALLCMVPLLRFYRDFDWSYDHRSVARAIADRDAPGDVMLFVQPYEALYYRWYLGSTLPMAGLMFTALEEQGGYIIKPPDLRLDVARRRVEQAARQYRRFWIVGQSRRSFASNAVVERQLLAWMDREFTRVADLSSLTGGDPVVRLYASARNR